MKVPALWRPSPGFKLSCSRQTSVLWGAGDRINLLAGQGCREDRGRPYPHIPAMSGRISSTETSRKMRLFFCFFKPLP